MKELVFAGRSLFVGDAAADAVVDYTAVLARTASADTVELRAVTEAGNRVEAYLVLDSAAPVMAQTADHDEPEPDNAQVVSYMRAAIHRLNPDAVDYVLGALDPLE
jgi:hypothetical protein